MSVKKKKAAPKKKSAPKKKTVRVDSIKTTYTYALHLSQKDHERILKIRETLPFKPTVAAVAHEALDKGLTAIERS